MCEVAGIQERERERERERVSSESFATRLPSEGQVAHGRVQQVQGGHVPIMKGGNRARHRKRPMQFRFSRRPRHSDLCHPMRRPRQAPAPTGDWHCGGCFCWALMGLCMKRCDASQVLAVAYQVSVSSWRLVICRNSGWLHSPDHTGCVREAALRVNPARHDPLVAEELTRFSKGCCQNAATYKQIVYVCIYIYTYIYIYMSNV